MRIEKLLIGVFLASVFLTGNVAASGNILSKIMIDNEDDSNVFANFFVDGSFVSGFYIPVNQSKVHYYYLTPGKHELEINWKDTGTCSDMSNKKNFSITEGKTPVLNLSTTFRDSPSLCTRKVKTNLEVFVKNEDDDSYYMDLRVGNYGITEYVPAGEKKNFFDFRITPGYHQITLKWMDPDVGEFRKKVKSVYVEEGKTGLVEISNYKYQAEREKYESFIDPLVSPLQ